MRAFASWWNAVALGEAARAWNFASSEIDMTLPAGGIIIKKDTAFSAIMRC